MKHIVAVLIFCFSSLAVWAQEGSGLKRERVFVGSGINFAFFNGFIIGLNPEVGYSVGKILDVGLAANVTYITQRYSSVPATDRMLIAGGGPFVRIWPIQQFFVGSQFEFNSVSFSTKMNGQVFNRSHFTAPSLLVGAGYGTRLIGQQQFYTSIMVDVLGNDRSPYTDGLGRAQPVFRTAFTFYLRQPKAPRR
ncbi:MAG: hypothetical protein ACK4E8_09965 [Lacibacter sp.]|jgi:hypothetical protein